MKKEFTQLYWNDKAKTFTISDREGEFPGMLKERTFNIVLVDKNKETGIEISEPDKTINYSGKKLLVNF